MLLKWRKKIGTFVFFIVAAVAAVALVGIGIFSGYHYLFAVTENATAVSSTWTFDAANDYTASDSAKIEVASGVARLIAVDQTDSDGTSTGFGGGTHSSTQWDSTNNWLELTSAGQTAGSGDYTSRVFDAGASTSWEDFTLAPERPINKDLPDSAQTETGYPTGNAVMTNNVLLMHLNESSGSILDTSGQGNNGTVSGGVTYNATGKFNGALNLDGTNGLVTLGTSAVLRPASAITVEFWMNADSTKSVQFPVSYGDTAFQGWNFYLNNSAMYWNVRNGTTFVSGAFTFTNPTSTWHHIVGTYNDPTSLLYVDGALKNTKTITGPISYTGLTAAYIGNGEGLDANRYFDGRIDEVAIYSQALTATEILDRYKRGSQRLNYQVRSCDDSACDGETLIGSDGTSATFYDEINNASTTPPAFNFTGVTNNRYFQYKAYLGTSSTSYSPELTSVSITPTHYPGDSPTVTNKAGAPFAKLTGFEDTVTTGTVTYQVSNNGSTWYYLNGERWTATASDVSRSNASTDITTKRLSNFHQQVGGGSFYFKAFLQSSGSNQYTTLDQVSLTYDTSITDEKIIMYPVIESIVLGDGSNVAKTRDIPVTIKGSNILRYKIETKKEDLKDTQKWIRFDKDKPIVYSLAEGDGIKTLYLKFMSWDGADSDIFTKTILLNTSDTARCVVPEAECVVSPGACVLKEGSTSCVVSERTCKVPESLCTTPEIKKPISDTVGVVSTTPFATSTEKLKIEPPQQQDEMIEPTIPQATTTAKQPAMEPLSTATELVDNDLFMVSSINKYGQSIFWYQQGKKRPFFNEETFIGWFGDNFESVKIKKISQVDADAIPLGDAVPFKSNSRLIKIKINPNVYEVGEGGRLCRIKNEFRAISRYGLKWKELVVDVPIHLFLNTYKIEKNCEN